MLAVTDGGRALRVLADPTRRAVFERLRGGPAAVGEIAAGLPVTRSAVSQHLRALNEAGLVQVRAEGTRRLYRVDPHGLGELRAWVDGFWDSVLGSFAQHVEAPDSAGAGADQEDDR